MEETRPSYDWVVVKALQVNGRDPWYFAQRFEAGKMDPRMFYSPPARFDGLGEKDKDLEVIHSKSTPKQLGVFWPCIALPDLAPITRDRILAYNGPFCYDGDYVFVPPSLKEFCEFTTQMHKRLEEYQLALEGLRRGIDPIC